MQDQPQSLLGKHITKAQAALGRKQYDEAIREWTAAINCDPHNASCFLGRGFAHALLKMQEAALSDYDTAVELDPGNLMALLNRGALHFDNARLREALADTTLCFELARAASDVDTQVAALVNRAGMYNLSGQSSQALADFTYALELAPESAWVHYSVARFYAELGQDADVAVELKSAIECEPLLRRSAFMDQAFGAVRSRPAVAVVLGDPAMAIPNPETSPDYVCRGQLYEQMGHMQQALADYHASLALDPQNDKALYLLAAYYGRMQRAEEAAQLLTVAVRINPMWRESARDTTDFTNLSNIPIMASALGFDVPLSY